MAKQALAAKNLGGKTHTMYKKIQNGETKTDESLTGCDQGTHKTALLAKYISINESLKGLSCNR
jgi:hypothetical protein